MESRVGEGQVMSLRTHQSFICKVHPNVTPQSIVHIEV
jgi:hypothetical protein